MQSALREPVGRVNKRPMIDLIIDHLNQFGSITNLEAQARYRCRALPRRIKDISELGYRIRKEWKRDDAGQRYVRYFLDGSAPAPVVEKPQLRVGARIRLIKDNGGYGVQGQRATVIAFDGKTEFDKFTTQLEVRFDTAPPGLTGLAWYIEEPDCFEVIG